MKHRKVKSKSTEKAAENNVIAPGWENIRYFTPREFTCSCDGMCDHPTAISMDLVKELDEIREAVGMPIKITSGTRCARHNRKVGGAPKSAHVPVNGVSHAADIACPNSLFRYLFLTHAFGRFRRIGIAEGFIHVDNDPNLPQDVAWTY